jgi:hypothetical protein
MDFTTLYILLSIGVPALTLGACLGVHAMLKH